MLDVMIFFILKFAELVVLDLDHVQPQVMHAQIVIVLNIELFLVQIVTVWLATMMQVLIYLFCLYL